MAAPREATPEERAEALQRDLEWHQQCSRAWGEGYRGGVRDGRMVGALVGLVVTGVVVYAASKVIGS